MYFNETQCALFLMIVFFKEALRRIDYGRCKYCLIRTGEFGASAKSYFVHRPVSQKRLGFSAKSSWARASQAETFRG